MSNKWPEFIFVVYEGGKDVGYFPTAQTARWAVEAKFLPTELWGFPWVGAAWFFDDPDDIEGNCSIFSEAFGTIRIQKKAVGRITGSLLDIATDKELRDVAQSDSVLHRG